MSDLGVVDPIRVPAPVAGAAERIRQLPMIARAFLAIAAIDALARLLGLIEPRAFIVDVVGVVGFFVPRDLWILLPALVLICRATAADDTPRVFRGAVLIAIVTLIAQPTIAVLTGAGGDPDVPRFILLGTITNLLLAWGYVWLGLGLTALNPPEPRPAVAGLANLVGGGIAVGVGVQLIVQVATGSRSALEPWIDTANLVGSIVAQLTLAYFLRAVVRGLDDPSRSEGATRSAAAGSALVAVASVFDAGLGILSTVLRDTPAGQQTLISISEWASTSIGVLYLAGYILLIAGFALGLANPLRPMAKAWEAAAT